MAFIEGRMVAFPKERTSSKSLEYWSWPCSSGSSAASVKEGALLQLSMASSVCMRLSGLRLGCPWGPTAHYETPQLLSGQ